jgi:6-pyruvoyltetrahydropterin/6-carboxytetrahydropterin synthase
MDMKVLADLIDAEVCERFDHMNLNLDTAEFKELIPSAENICVVILRLENLLLVILMLML